MSSLNDQFDYITEQGKTWKMLGLSDLMELPFDAQVPVAMSADDYNAYLQNGSVTSTKIRSISASQITTSVLEARIDIGTGSVGSYLRLDGPNNRFVLSDGITPRIVIGEV